MLTSDRIRRWSWAALILGATCGCGSRPVTGGTPGRLRSGDDPLAEIQVTVHRFDGDSSEAIGFGVTGMDGTFVLFTHGAKGPLHLPPGEYRFTLESVGSPLRIPAVLTHASTTPLHVKWSPGDRNLELELPK